MDPIELEYDNLESVPETFRDLYTEVGDKYVLTNVNGMKTTKDVLTVQESLRKERENHKATNDLLKPWKSYKFEDIQGMVEKYPELEAAAAGKLDDAAIEAIVTGRIKQKTSPLEARILEFETGQTERDTEINRLRSAISDRDRSGIVSAAAAKSNVHASAIADIELNAKFAMEFDDQGKLVTRSDIPGVTPGLDVHGWLKEMQKTRTHWWPESEGGGSRGGGGGALGDNPWSEAKWNLTDQGKVLKEQGREAADRLAKAAGSRVGAVAPTVKKT